MNCYSEARASSWDRTRIYPFVRSLGISITLQNNLVTTLLQIVSYYFRLNPTDLVSLCEALQKKPISRRTPIENKGQGILILQKANEFYAEEYLKKNPSLHTEDSPYKVTLITPLADKFAEKTKKSKINILDVGGGAGLILRDITTHLVEKYGLIVNKYILDLSPVMLKTQTSNNLDISKALNESICKTTLREKEIDLTLMIDVLEHIPNPHEALTELNRISDFTIFNVPLERCVTIDIGDYFKGNRNKNHSRQQYGHVNFYNSRILHKSLEENLGKIVENKYAKYPATRVKQSITAKILTKLSQATYDMSPRVWASIYGGSEVILVRSES